MPKSDYEKHSGFWFGLMMGGLVGSSALYFFGTKKGRDRMKEMLEVFEDFDEDRIEEILKSTPEIIKKTAKNEVVPDIHTVLDKIQSSLPNKKDVKKYLKKNSRKVK